jgi:hypothetical protein
MDKRTRYSETLKRFAPEVYVPYLVDTILQSKVVFKIVPGRKSKLGDFRANLAGELPTITVNGDLNPYSFLVTTLHEIAHLRTFNNYGHRVNPHGEEWKNAFRKLLIPVLDSKNLPEDLEKALWKSFTNTKASSCSDLNLSRALKKYDKPTLHQSHTLEEIPMNSHFSLNGKVFKKGNLRRSRYLCTDLNGKQYLVHALASIEIIESHEK